MRTFKQLVLVPGNRSSSDSNDMFVCQPSVRNGASLGICAGSELPSSIMRISSKISGGVCASTDPRD
eukprot:10881436-Heterocapsa_arctica.AAC.1